MEERCNSICQKKFLKVQVDLYSTFPQCILEAKLAFEAFWAPLKASI